VRARELKVPCCVLQDAQQHAHMEPIATEQHLRRDRRFALQQNSTSDAEDASHTDGPALLQPCCTPACEKETGGGSR
jgi:hypothetical protein